MTTIPGVSVEVENGRIRTSIDGPLTVTGDLPSATLSSPLRMGSRREAFLVTTSSYEDPQLRRLAAPPGRVATLLQPLFDEERGKFHAWPAAVDRNSSSVTQDIKRFLSNRSSGDVLLLYIAGVAIFEEGRLYFATSETSLESPAASSIPASFLHEQLVRSKARRIAVILDCAYTSSFSGTEGPVPGEWIDLSQELPRTGRAIITAPPVLRAAPKTKAVAKGLPNLAALVHRGLRDGEADGKPDGFVTIDDLFKYLVAGVEQTTPDETAVVLDAGAGSKFVVAHSGRTSSRLGVERPQRGRLSRSQRAPADTGQTSDHVDSTLPSGSEQGTGEQTGGDVRTVQQRLRDAAREVDSRPHHSASNEASTGQSSSIPPRPPHWTDPTGGAPSPPWPLPTGGSSGESPSGPSSMRDWVRGHVGASVGAGGVVLTTVIAVVVLLLPPDASGVDRGGSGTSDAATSEPTTVPSTTSPPSPTTTVAVPTTTASVRTTMPSVRTTMPSVPTTPPPTRPQVPPRPIVPDVTNLSEQQAVARLEAAGFTVDITRWGCVCSVPKGYAYRTNPPAGYTWTTSLPVSLHIVA